MPMPKKQRMCCLSCGNVVDRPGGIYCNNICQHEHQHREYIKLWKLGVVNGCNANDLSVSDHIRRYLFEKYNSKCSRCEWGEINVYTGRVPLTVEHKDGNPTNNTEENLDLICPNCHSLTSTYQALNKGKGRKSRKQYDLWKSAAIT